MGYWKVRVAIPAVCRKFWDRRLYQLCQTEICILTRTLVPLLFWHFPHQFFSLRFVSRQEHCLVPSVLFFEICISTGTLSSSLTALALSPSVLFGFILFSGKIIWKSFQHSFQKNGEWSYFAAEIQAWLWTAQEFSAETTQSAIQNLILQQQERERLILFNYRCLCQYLLFSAMVIICCVCVMYFSPL